LNDRKLLEVKGDQLKEISIKLEEEKRIAEKEKEKVKNKTESKDTTKQYNESVFSNRFSNLSDKDKIEEDKKSPNKLGIGVGAGVTGFNLVELKEVNNKPKDKEIKTDPNKKQDKQLPSYMNKISTRGGIEIENKKKANIQINKKPSFQVGKVDKIEDIKKLNQVY